MAEKRHEPYFPEQMRNPNDQRELIYVNSKVGLASFNFFVRKDELRALNYPEDFFSVGEFNGLTRQAKHIERVRSLHEIVGPLGYQIDDGIQTLLTVDIKKDRSLNAEEKKEAVDFVDAVIQTNNYYERLVSNGGNTQIFTATPETSRNGVVSTADGARLNMKHLRVIVKNIPEVSDVVAILDREYSRQFDLDHPDTWKSKKPEEIIAEISKPVDMTNERFESIKNLARAWYDLLGMPDIRSNQHKNSIIKKYMPKPIIDKNDVPDLDEYKTRYSKDPKKFEEYISKYKGIELEYNSVFTFILDPIKLQSGVLKNFKGLCLELAMTARYGDQSEHNIFNLGWIPAGYRVLENIAQSNTKGTTDAVSNLKYDELHSWSFTGMNQLKSLTDDQWKNIEDAVDWQKIMINNLEKADGAKVAFLKLFAFDPKAIGDLYGSVASYLRDSKKDSSDRNMFNRNQILPMLSSAVIRIFSALKDSGFMPVDRRQMMEVVAKVEQQMWPDEPFTEKQRKILINDLSIDSAALAMFKVGK